MKSLNGTEKQVEWANDIRAKFLAAHPSIADLAADVFTDATQWINARHDLSAVAGAVFGALLAAGREQEIVARLVAECRADLTRAIVTEYDGSRRIPHPMRVIGDVVGWAGALRSLRSSSQENRLWVLVGANTDAFLDALLAPIDGLDHDSLARSEAEDMIRDAVALATRPAPARRAR